MSTDFSVLLLPWYNALAARISPTRPSTATEMSATNSTQEFYGNEPVDLRLYTDCSAMMSTRLITKVSAL